MSGEKNYFKVLLASFALIACQQQKPTTQSIIETKVDTALHESIHIEDVENRIELYTNDSIELSIYLDNGFKLIELKDGKSILTKGNLNYERGFEDDIDATLYVLDFDKPKQERYFVRLTKDNVTLIPLDQNRKSFNKAPLHKEIE